MLNLASETSSGWVGHALARVEDLLLDHAHCEKRAASTALGLIFRHPELPHLLDPLSKLAREELEHFERCLALIRSRGGEYRRVPPSGYAAELKSLMRHGRTERIVDTLLCCALVEARSCERMKLLADALPDAGLAAFYRDLLASEARHHQTYVDLACGLEPASRVRERLAALAAGEAGILRRLPPGPRLHDGG